MRRIRALLADAKGAAPADMAGFQNDVLSPYALRVLGNLSRMPRPEGEAGRALGILERWDGHASRTGISRLFYAFLFELVTRKKLAGWQAAEDAIAKAASVPDPVIAEALAAALGKVEREDGKDPASWSWGRIHRLEYEHPFSPMVPAALRWLRRWLDVGPLELPGEVHTVDAEGFSLSRAPRVTYIPSARIVIDLGNPDASTLVLPLGESGQFQDAHYDDQVQAWAEGRTFPFPFTRPAVDAAATSTLRLEP